jgi:hypothetical protein
VHLNAIYSSLNELKQEALTLSDLLLLLNQLSIYELDPFVPESISSPRNQKLEKIKSDAAELLEKLLRDICVKFNQLWSDDLKTLDSCYLQLYACFLSGESKALFDLLVRVNYEVDRELILTFDKTEPTPILSVIVKMYSNQDHMWRKLFLYCYTEKKLLLKTLLDECLSLIAASRFDNLATLFTVKEFLSAKPLVLVLGFSKVQNTQSARKMISVLCSSAEKGSLIDKIGCFLKTHLDFMTWFEQIKPEARKKDMSFGELTKLLQKQLPLNIISQYVDLADMDAAEVTKILRNTLVDTDTCQATARWVRFVDEENEKISEVQEACLAVYNGFYCINEVQESILYCCMHINHKLYSRDGGKRQNSTTSLRSNSAVESEIKQKLTNLEQLKRDYATKV